MTIYSSRLFSLNMVMFHSYVSHYQRVIVEGHCLLGSHLLNLEVATLRQRNYWINRSRHMNWCPLWTDALVRNGAQTYSSILKLFPTSSSYSETSWNPSLNEQECHPLQTGLGLFQLCHPTVQPAEPIESIAHSQLTSTNINQHYNSHQWSHKFL